MAWACPEARQLTAYYWGKNVWQGYSWYEKDGVIAWYDGRERLRTVERFNLRQIEMDHGDIIASENTCQKPAGNIIIIIIFYFHLKNQTRYSAITFRVIQLVGCQKSKCSSSWPLITTFMCIVNMQTFIPAFTQTHSIPTIQTSKRPKSYYASCKKTSGVRFTVVYCNPTIIIISC